jgi:hypothetical protein
VLTFIAQDGEQRTILYANAELTAREQPGEVIEFCRFYERTRGTLPKLLVRPEAHHPSAPRRARRTRRRLHHAQTALPETDRHARRAARQLAGQIRAFHLDSLCSQVPLAVDFDVALTILADLTYRRFAKGLHPAYHNQTPDTIRSTSPTASASCASHPATSKSASNDAPTPPHYSTPATKTTTPKSPGGADAPSATASTPDPETLNRTTAPRIQG